MTTALIRRDFYVAVNNRVNNQTIYSYASTYETGSCIHLNFNPLLILPEDRPPDERIWLPLSLQYMPFHFGGWYSYECSDLRVSESSMRKAFDLYNQNVKRVVIHHVVPHTRKNGEENCSWEALTRPIAALCSEVFPNLQKEACQMIVYK